MSNVDVIELRRRACWAATPRSPRGRSEMLTPPSLPMIRCFGLRRVDPHRVVIDVDALGAVVAERLAAVVRDVQRHAEHVDARVGLRIDADLAEVHRPRIGVAHLAPAGAGVVGAVDAALGRVLDARVERRSGLRAVDVHADAALGPGRDAVLELASTSGRRRSTSRSRCRGRRRSCPTARAGADRSRRRAPCCSAGSITSSVAPVSSSTCSDALPGQAAVGGLVDAALAAGRPQVAERRDVDDVEVDRVDDDARDLLAGARGPCSSTCGRRRWTCRRRRPTTSSGGCCSRRCRPRPGWRRSARWRCRRSTPLPSLSKTDGERGAALVVL